MANSETYMWFLNHSEWRYEGAEGLYDIWVRKGDKKKCEE